MSISLKKAVRALGAVMALGVVLLLDSSALAQTSRPGSAPSSVLPTGGGQALLDPSDTVILLLDHQSGLFQTVKDINLAELRSNVTLIVKVATLLKIPVITIGIGAQRTEWAADAGDPPIRTPCGLRAAQGRSERLGQRGLRQDGACHRPEDADHGGRLDERLRDVPGA